MAYLSWSAYSVLLRDIDAPSFPSLKACFWFILKKFKNKIKIHGLCQQVGSPTDDCFFTDL